MGNFTVPAPYAPLLLPGIKTVIEESGRSTGKSTTNNRLAVTKMLESKDNNIWQARADSVDLRKTSFSAMLRAIDDLGRVNYFRTSLNPLEITCTWTGAKCYFTGINGKTLDDLTATKGFEPQGGKLAMLIVDEANEAKSGEMITAAKTTASKFLNPDGTIVFAYNPSLRPNHWSHSYFNAMAQSGTPDFPVYKVYATWEDVEDLLKETTVREIKHMRDTDPVHYSFTYLGQPITESGRVIWTFNREKNLLSLAALQRRIMANLRYQPLRMYYGVDSGLKHDRTAVSAWGFYPDGLLIKLYTMYLNTSARPMGIPHSEQAVKMLEWYGQMKAELNSYDIYLPDPQAELWCFDGAAITQDLMLEWRKLTGFRCKAVTNKDVEKDYARLRNSYESGLLQILDIAVNKPAIDEIENFCRDESQDIPEGQADHTIDADKYATYEYYYALL